MQLKGAIFDLDGTLLDSMFIWESIGDDYLLSIGITPHEELKENYKAMSLYQAACYYREVYNLPYSAQQIMDAINAMVEQHYFNEVKSKDGVSEFLENLAQRQVKMCVATMTDAYLAKAALERNGIAHYFSSIFTCTEIGKGKDQPDIYLTALEHLGTNKENTLVFEDSRHSIQTAKGAGFTVVGLYDASETQQDKVKELADYYFTKLSEIELGKL